MDTTESFAAIDTPAPLLDLDVMERNVARMAAYTREHALALRPHVKTHKSPVVARAQLAAGATGLTCATTFEASVMAEASHDLLVMYPPVGAARLARMMALPGDVRLTVALDSIEAVAGLAAAARSHDRQVRVLVELDAGMHRTGAADTGDIVTLARAVRDAGASLTFGGVAFYPGHIRERVEAQDDKLRVVAHVLDDTLVALARAGMAAGIVSGGSTPAAWRMHEVRGLTEVRPGTYVFNDRTTAEIGACAWEDCAVTVLATVVSTAVAGQVVVDAGSKALGREPLRAGAEDGFASVHGEPTLVVRAMSEEHGIIDVRGNSWRPRVGDRVRLVPNHVCIVVHLNDVLVTVRGNVVEGALPVAARGRHTVATRA